ncbi:GNAT superfamily N-acetyltransferase [Streptosporangium becharense]|uniref:GNAT superfamily N-acetyltransferase n=1 Tax=Streptosporangium becharense TaxID=1816182 RepID=A0A7W9IIW7_9ACTN|nr:GNAT family N-acetyltransferase [Streptosporangium becharense]MBB2911389.1 GNAT superfamily N-acetyltransferase [Streptosporangium becharense]MBB5821553.1 GNAT superfamily N-acetyltransferase [Streptosporangium becharense]
MSDLAPSVRSAVVADLPAIADTLTDAFADYAWTRWTVAEDDHLGRLRALQTFFTERVGLPYGEVWVTDDVSAVAIWTRPDTVVPPEVFTAPELAELYGDRISAAMSAEEILAGHRPAEPCRVLASIGVRRERQGLGLGSAVLRPGLEEADRGGHPAYLETSDRRNVDFYARHGFEVTAEVELPDGGPRTWCMLRPPKRR